VLLQGTLRNSLYLAKGMCILLRTTVSLFMRIKRAILLIFIASAIWSLPIMSAHGQLTNANFQRFQQFVNGEIPVQEAIIYRRLTRTNGTVANQDWWRFGYQQNTWYVERLIPDPKDPSKLVPRPNGDICGAAFSELWTVSDKDIHAVRKDLAAGSIPNTFARMSENLMFSTLSLGVPRRLDLPTLKQAQIEWDGLEFKTIVPGKVDIRTSAVLEAKPLKGEIIVNHQGMPSSIEYSTVDGFGGGVVTYEYAPDSQGIPSAFNSKYSDEEFRYEFISLALGTNEFDTASGYVPSMFVATSNNDRHITIWTNSLPYSVIGSKTQPAFGVHQQRNGSIILIFLIIASATFLVLFYRRSK